MTDSEVLKAIYSDMQGMKQQMNRIEDKVIKIELQIEKLEENVAELNQRMDRIENRMDSLENKVDTLEKDVTSIKLTLENEIRTNIKRVAEGHLDLSRNLHEAMRPSNEVETLAVRVNILEGDVKELKQKIS